MQAGRTYAVARCLAGSSELNENLLIELCERLVDAAKQSGADAAEAAAAWSRRAEASIENDDLHTVHADEETTIGVRVFRGNALGFVTTNRTDDTAIAVAVEEACAQARAMPSDPWNELPEPEPAPPVAGLWDDHAAGLTVEDTTALSLNLLDRVKTSDPRVKIDSGSVSVTTHRQALLSSAGVRFAESGTSLDAQLFGMAVDGEKVASFDYDSESSRKAEGFTGRCDELARRFVEKCLFGLETSAGRSFKGPVLLSPDAVAEFLLPNLCAAMAADAVRKGKSPLAHKLDTAIASDAFTLIDDPRRPAGAASTAADREGVPTKKSTLIEAGVLRSFLFNHYEALARGHGQRSTGHASGSAASLPGISPHQLEIAPGSATLDSLLDTGSQPAIYVGRFSGSTNPVTGDFSGVAKNSALLLGGAKIPVHETAVAGNLYDLLRKIVAVSAERHSIGGAHLLPFVLADGVSVTAG